MKITRHFLEVLGKIECWHIIIIATLKYYNLKIVIIWRGKHIKDRNRLEVQLVLKNIFKFG